MNTGGTLPLGPAFDDCRVKSEDGVINNLKVEDDTIIKKEEPEDGVPFQRKIFIAAQKKRKRKKRAKVKPLAGIKNVVKNYGKAMCSFASSELSLPYLQPILDEEGLTIKEFTDWIQNNKEGVDSIESLRSMLLVTDQDSETGSFKRTFQKISVVFLKFFSVNWIYSGKLRHTHTHLILRHKMLRRIRNPEMFTYLQNASKNNIR